MIPSAYRAVNHLSGRCTRKHGVEVILQGDDFDEAKAHALALERLRGLTLVHPYDDEKVIAGQGTIALEMLREHPQLDLLLIAVRRGGLIAGIATAAKAIKPAIEVVGVQTMRFPSMYCALRGTAPEFGASTIAEGIAVKEPGRLTREIAARLVTDMMLVDEGDIEQAIVMLLEIEKTVVEGAGAASLPRSCGSRAASAAARSVSCMVYVSADNPQRDYAVAIAELDEFLAQYPQNTHAEEARNWRQALKVLLDARRENDRLNKNIEKLKQLDMRQEEKRLGI